MQKANLEFRKIPSLDFFYEINEDGTIIRNSRSKKVLKCRKHNHNSKTEYWCLNINLKGKIRKVYIHEVVAECWLGPNPEGMQIDHIDRDSLNNHYTNLRYVTKSEQMMNRNHEEFLDKIYSNLALCNNGIINPVRLSKGGFSLEFPSAKKAARFLADMYPGKKIKSFSDKFYLRRKKIFDYDVTYRNAETGHGNQDMGKEQSTTKCISSEPLTGGMTLNVPKRKNESSIPVKETEVVSYESTDFTSFIIPKEFLTREFLTKYQ